MTTTERQQAVTYLTLIQTALIDGTTTTRDRERGRAALTLLWDLVGEAHGAESHARRRPRVAKATAAATTA